MIYTHTHTIVLNFNVPLQANGSLFFFVTPLSKLSVIGRGGEQISRMQQESGCKIQIAPGKHTTTFKC